MNFQAVAGKVSCGKTFTLILVALFLTLALLVPSMANGQITSSYSNNSHINPTAFTLTIYSPENQTYTSTMPLNFTIEWTEYPSFSGLPSPPAPTLDTTYSYRQLFSRDCYFKSILK